MSTEPNRARHQGITIRHSRRCRSLDGGRCTCRPSYQAQAYSARDKKTLRRTFPTLAAAKAWRADAQGAIRRGALRAQSALTISEACDAWLSGAKAGAIRNRSGEPYKPSVLRGYEGSIERHIRPELGSRRLSALTRLEVQDLADRLLATGLDPSTVRNALMPLRALYRRAVARSEVALNPTRGLELPAVRGRRDRIASPAEAAALIAAVPERDRAIWATAMYGGLRLGEIRGLQWDDIDLKAGVIRVERSWDPKAGVIETKSGAGRRKVPIADVLRRHLAAERLRQGRADGPVFRSRNGKPIWTSGLTARAKETWEAAGLQPIRLHECRHTFASLMIAAGVNAKALSTYMGHASITITLDRYGHLMPGNEEESAALLDWYLTRRQPRAAASGQA